MKLVFSAVLAVSFAVPAAAGGALGALRLEAAAPENLPVLAAPPQAAAAPAEDLGKGKTPLIEIDASVMKDKASLMAEFSLKLGAPVDNWDGLIDYLSDMPDLLKAKKVQFLVRRSQALQARDKALYENLLGAAQAAAERTREWSRGRASVEFFFLP